MTVALESCSDVHPKLLMEDLKDMTLTAHRAVEALPFNMRIMDEEITRPQYGQLLMHLLHMHTCVTHALGESTCVRVRSVSEHVPSKVNLLKGDLRSLEILPMTFADNPFEAWATQDQCRLLGALYVLEGSTLGGMVIRKRIAAALSLDEDEIQYYTGYGRDTAARWAEFKSRMNALQLTQTERADVIDGANQTFELFAAMFRHLELVCS